MLLKNCFSIPKLQYLLRSSPAYKKEDDLKDFDQTLKEAVSLITNVAFKDESWDQATLPVGLGGLGFRRAFDIALPSFISSAYSVRSLVEAILSNVQNMAETEELLDAVTVWNGRCGDSSTPEGIDTGKQKCWDLPIATVIQEKLLNETNQVSRARVLAASCKETGLWLHAIPIPALGTLFDPETLRIAVALRVGANVCEPHPCRCGQNMDELGLHGLSCKFSAGRFPRHAALNDVMKRSLQRAGLPSVLEPLGMDRGDGKRPDGVTVFPFKNGKSLCWDCTCLDTFAETHLINSAINPGSAANSAEDRKRRKYSALANQYQFEPIAVETTGVYGKTTSLTLREIGRRLIEVTGEPRESLWFKQRIAIAVQRGNAVSILSAGRECREKL